MRKEKEIVEEAIKVTAMLVKENTELKKENQELKFLLRWSWENAGKVFLKKFLPIVRPPRIIKQERPRPSTTNQFRRLRSYVSLKQ